MSDVWTKLVMVGICETSLAKKGSRKWGTYSLDAGARVGPLASDRESKSVVLCNVNELDSVLVAGVVDVVDPSAEARSISAGSRKERKETHLL